jgi:FeS assembly SUF system protein
VNPLNFFKSKKSKEEQTSAQEIPLIDGKHNVQAPVPPKEDESKKTTVPNEKPTEPIDIDAVEKEIIKSFKTVYDPEIPVDIYELGLIYEIKIESDGNTYVKMTLTSPNCPVAGILPGQVESAARGVEGVYDVKLDLVFDPPWGPDRMSEAAKLELGML